VRGADVAGGHATEVVRCGPAARPEGARALAGDVMEGAPKSAQASPAGAECDLGDRQVGVAEQRCGALDAPREQIPVRRDAEDLLERSREVGFGDAADARQAPHGPALMRGGIHPILCAQQSPQQLGILVCRIATRAISGCRRGGMFLGGCLRALGCLGGRH